MSEGWSRHARLSLLVAGVTAFYAVLAFAVLSHDAVYSGDSAVKFVQARGLAAQRFLRTTLPYPGAYLDPDRDFFPFVRPFVFRTHWGDEAVFPPAAALMYAPVAAPTGLVGMAALSVAAGGVIIWIAGRLAAGRARELTVLALGLGTCLWFYAVVPWEHAPAVALAMGAFAAAASAGTARREIVAGLLLGVAASIRDETLLVAPGVLLVAVLQSRRASTLARIVGMVIAVLAVAGTIETLVYNRPMAAHLRHAVHLLGRAFHVIGTPNPEVPSLRPLTIDERLDIVVHQWLMGYDSLRALVFAVAVVMAAAIQKFTRSSAGVLVVFATVAGLAARDVWAHVGVPRFEGGLYRMSPFLAFAIAPAPRVEGAPVPRWLLLAACGAYIVVAFAGLDTTGGKSLGPRLLLPIVPLLAIAACDTATRYWYGARGATDRAVALVGGILVALSIAYQLISMVPAYVGRNREDAAVIAELRRAEERIIVADDPFTAQLVAPLYFRKVIYLADNPAAGRALGERLSAARVRGVLLVSREGQPRIELPPYGRATRQAVGRMVVERWTR